MRIGIDDPVFRRAHLFIALHKNGYGHPMLRKAPEPSSGKGAIRALRDAQRRILELISPATAESSPLVTAVYLVACARRCIEDWGGAHLMDPTTLRRSAVALIQSDKVGQNKSPRASGNFFSPSRRGAPVQNPWLWEAVAELRTIRLLRKERALSDYMIACFFLACEVWDPILNTDKAEARIREIRRAFARRRPANAVHDSDKPNRPRP